MAKTKAMIGVLIEPVELYVIIGWSTKFMVIEGIVMQFRGIMSTAIVVLFSSESSVNYTFGAVGKEIDKYEFQPFDFLIFHILFSHTIKYSDNIPIRSSIVEAVWVVSLAWLEVDCLQLFVIA
jgi:hypothetical protein